MNDALIPILKAQIELDPGLLRDGRRLAGLLNDLKPELRNARNLVIAALDAGVAAALAQAAAPVDALTIDRLVTLMIEDYSVTEQAARWAVRAWSQALGKLAAPRPPADPAAPRGWELRGQAELGERHRMVVALAWHPGGELLLSGNPDPNVRVWSLVQPGRLALSKVIATQAAWATDVGWVRDGTEILSAGHGWAEWWSVRGISRRALRYFGAQTSWTADGAVLAVAKQPSILLWDAATRQVARHFAGASQSISAMALSADGRWLAGAGITGVVDVWQVDGERHLGQFQHAPAVVLALAWHPRQPLVAWSGQDGTLALADAATGEIRVLPSALQSVRCLAWHPDGALLAAADSEGRIEIWHAPSGNQEAFWPAHNRVYALAWHPGAGYAFGGPLLASGGGDGLIRLWEEPR